MANILIFLLFAKLFLLFFNELADFHFLSWLNLRTNKGVVVWIIDRVDRKRSGRKRKCFNAISQ